MADLDSFDENPEGSAHKPEIHLADYWAIVVKRWRLIVAGLVAALVVGVLGTILTQPLYQATVVLDVVRKSASPLTFGSSRGEGDSDSEFLPSQIQLMQSREIAERVVRKLNLLADPAFNPKGFERFVPEAKGNARAGSDQDIVEAAINVQGAIDATIIRGTSLVQITCTAPSAKLAAGIANAVADSYIDWNIESRFRLIGQSSQFLASQIEQAKSEIEAKERELLAYGRQKEIVSTDSSNPALQRLDSVNKDLAAAVTDRVGKEARYEEMRAAKPEVLADASSNGTIATMRAELQKLERDYADKLNVYKPEWPAMLQLKGQIDQSRQALQLAIGETSAKVVETARNEYLTALRRETSLKSMTRVQQSEALTQGSNAVEYKNLRVEIDTKRALLDNLLRQQGETEVISRIREDQFTSIRIVDRALDPAKPFKPSLKKNLLMALVAGIALGVGMAFLLSYLDRTFRTSEQVERFLQLPSLGIIPSRGAVAPDGSRWSLRKAKQTPPEEGGEHRKETIELLPHGEPRSPIAEAYRALRTSVLLSRAGGVKIIAVTSAIPREGKTTTAANLAVVLAQLGRRVLIVDADLHQARLHEIFRVSNRIGLVSILAEGMEPSRAIVKTKVPGVFVVPAGPDAPNPSSLLASDAMRKFLELAVTNFDHVIVDTPPVLAVSDTLVFAQQTDGVVLCVRGGQTSREVITRARDRIVRSGIPILGVVINALQAEPGSYPQYGYGYPAESKREPANEPAAPPVAHTS